MTVAMLLPLALVGQSQDVAVRSSDVLVTGRITAAGWSESYSVRTSGEAVPTLVARPESNPLLQGQVGPVETLSAASFRVTIVEGERTTVRTVQIGQGGAVKVEDATTWRTPGARRYEKVARFELVDPGGVRSAESWPQTGSELRVSHPVVGLVGPRVGAALVRDASDARRNRPGLGWVEARANRLGIGFADPEGNPALLPREAVNRFSVVLGEGDRRPTRGLLGRLLWQQNVPRRAAVAVPQSVPFRYASRSTYSPLMPSRRTGSPGRWWTKHLDGRKLGGPGDQEESSFVAGRNLLRAGWAMRWWGERLRQTPWVDRSEETLNLALAGPLGPAATARVVYRPAADRWEPGTVADVAETAHWLGRWAQDFPAIAARPDVQAALDRTDRWLLEAAIDTRAGLRDLVRVGRALEGRLAQRRAQGSDAERIERALAVVERRLRPHADPTLSDALELGLWATTLREPGTRSTDDGVRALAERIAVGQALWASPNHPAPTFGAILDGGRLSQDGVEGGLTLMRAGAALDRQDLFQRGVIAVRAGFGLYRQNVAGRNGVTGPEGVGEGVAAAWASLLEGFSPDRSFEAGAGAFLATLAEVTQEFGSGFVGRSGWAVGIDGIAVGDGATWLSAVGANPFPYGGAHEAEIVRHGESERTAVAPVVPLRIARVEVRMIEGETWLVQAFTRPVSPADGTPRGVFTLGGETLAASGTLYGLGARVGPMALLRHPVSAGAEVGETTTDIFDQDVYVVPPLDPMAVAPRGWSRRGGLARTVIPSLGSGPSAPVSTADDGRARRDPSLVGSVLSAPFFPSPGRIVFSVSGTGGRVELIDADSLNPILTVSGKAPPTRVEWDVEARSRRQLRLRLVDDDPNGYVELRHARFEPAPTASR